METELKIRCYGYVFPDHNEASRVRHIQDFEWRTGGGDDAGSRHEPLEQRTGRRHYGRRSTLRDILSIRQEAQYDPGPVPAAGSIQWLHEYLSCSVLMASRPSATKTKRHWNRPPHIFPRESRRPSGRSFAV